MLSATDIETLAELSSELSHVAGHDWDRAEGEVRRALAGRAALDPSGGGRVWSLADRLNPETWAEARAVLAGAWQDAHAVVDAALEEMEMADCREDPPGPAAVEAGATTGDEVAGGAADGAERRLTIRQESWIREACLRLGAPTGLYSIDPPDARTSPRVELVAELRRMRTRHAELADELGGLVDDLLLRTHAGDLREAIDRAVEWVRRDREPDTDRMSRANTPFAAWRDACVRRIRTHPAMQPGANAVVAPDFESWPWAILYESGETVGQMYRDADDRFNLWGWS